MRTSNKAVLYVYRHIQVYIYVYVYIYMYISVIIAIHHGSPEAVAVRRMLETPRKPQKEPLALNAKPTHPM